ncbi:hypothetical protein, partial [Flagellimonas profundi]
SENGTPTTFDAKIATAVDNTDGTFTITDDFGTQVDIDTNETVTTLTDGNDGTFTYSSENGTPTTFDAKIATAVDNTDGTFTITDDFGTQVDIDTNETIVSTDSENSITQGSDGGAYLNTTVKPITSVITDTTPDNSNYTIILNSGTYPTGVTLLTDGTLPIGKIIILRNNSGGAINISGSTAASIANGQSLWVQFDGTIWQQIN